MYEEAKKKYLLQHGLEQFCPKAALIDMDGVLFDSMPNHARSWLKVLADNGIFIEEKEAYLHEGRTGRGTIEILYRRFFHREPTDDEVKDLYARKAALFDALPEATIMPGAPEVLDAIRDSGMQRILVTGSGQRLLLGRIDKHFPGHFTADKMVTAFDVKLGKPYPEPYLKGLEKGMSNNMKQSSLKTLLWGCRPPRLPAFSRLPSIPGLSKTKFYTMPDVICCFTTWVKQLQHGLTLLHLSVFDFYMKEQCSAKLLNVKPI